MQILIGCAKTMTSDTPAVEGCTMPAFQKNADEIALQLAAYSPQELKDMLRCSLAIAKENWLRYRHFADPVTRRPAIFSYCGIVFQKIAPESMSQADLEYANGHMFIGSFLYGLLRPLDLINPYRLEGNVELPGNGYASMFAYWRPRLTDWLISRVQADDGVLVNLASNEFRDIFDWKRVAKELEIVTPDFKVWREGRLKTIVVYAKMCRGAMARWIIEHRISDPRDLAAFEYEGFRTDGAYAFSLR